MSHKTSAQSTSRRTDFHSQCVCVCILVRVQRANVSPVHARDILRVFVALFASSSCNIPGAPHSGMEGHIPAPPAAEDMPGSRPLSLSPRKLRLIGNTALPLRLCQERQRLPKYEVVTVQSLWDFHVADLLETMQAAQSRRKRHRGKSALSLADVLARVTADEATAPGQRPTWRQRQAAFWQSLRVLALCYGTSQRQAHYHWKELWKVASDEVRDKWFQLTSHPDWASAWTADNAARDRDCTPPSALPGALFTWQTRIGRDADVVKSWMDAGIAGESLWELLSGELALKEEFGSFAGWFELQCREHGFHLWSACMEANTGRGRDAIVHLHAYGCLDWRRKGSMAWRLVDIRPEEWKYNGFLPDVRGSVIKGNMNPKKVIPPALFYCQATKIGSIFTAGNVTPGQDLFDTKPCTPAVSGPRSRSMCVSVSLEETCPQSHHRTGHPCIGIQRAGFETSLQHFPCRQPFAIDQWARLPADRADSI